MFSGYCPLGCGSVYLRRWIATFQRNLLLSSSTSTFRNIMLMSIYKPTGCTSPEDLIWEKWSWSSGNFHVKEYYYTVGMDNSGVNQWEMASCLVTQGSGRCPYYAPRHEGVLGNACVECWVDAFYRFSNLILLDKGKCADKVPIPLTARSKTWVGGRTLDGTADANPV